jgi:hypothetical protein
MWRGLFLETHHMGRFIFIRMSKRQHMLLHEPHLVPYSADPSLRDVFVCVRVCVLVPLL